MLSILLTTEAELVRSVVGGFDDTRHAGSLRRYIAIPRSYLHTPHLPPSFAQWRQYLQFLQAWQGSEPVQVAECSVAAAKAHVKRSIKENPAIEKGRDLSKIASSNRRMESVYYIRGNRWFGQQERPLPQRK